MPKIRGIDYQQLEDTTFTVGINTDTAESVLTIVPPADYTATGTTTASTATTITGIGTSFLTQVGIGDRISLSSSAGTFATVLAIASNTSLTVNVALGNGTSQTILVKKSLFRIQTTSSTSALLFDDTGTLGVGTITTIPPSVSAASGGNSIIMSGSGTGIGGDIHLITGAVTGAWETSYFKTRGTTGAAGTAVVSGDSVGTFRFYLDNGTTYSQAALMQVIADGTPTSTSSPGAIRFFTTPSGAVTPSERMRISSAGNMLINTTSAFISSNERVSIQGGSAQALSMQTSSATGPVFCTQNIDPTASANLIHMALFDVGGTNRAAIGVNSTDSAMVLGGNGYIAFRTNGNGLGGTERFRLMNTGQFKLFGASGSTNAFAAMDIDGNGSLTVTANALPANVGANTQIIFKLGTAGGGAPVEAMRMNSINQVSINGATPLVNTTTSIFYASTGTAGLGIQQTNASTGTFVNFLSSTSATIGSINNNNNGTVSYATSSDYRLKENVQDLASGLDKIALLQPRTFNFIGHDQNMTGFIAHEIQAVLPEAVHGVKDAVDANGAAIYQGVDASFVVPTLVKAIQELVAKCSALEARLTAAGA